MAGPMLVGFFSIHCLLVHAADHDPRKLELLMIADLLSDEENR